MNLTIIKKRSRLGFTLVELIVVIAILAILAGIAIPVYSNYIKKANKAADLQLLDAVNTAFAAACLENGVNPRSLSGVNLTITDKCISGVSITGVITTVLSNRNGSGPVFATLGAGSGHGAHFSKLAVSGNDISESFLKYFAGNTATELKYFKRASDFTFRAGCFVSKEDASSAVEFLGADSTTTPGTTTYTFQNENGESIQYTVDDDLKSAFLNSTLGQKMEPSDLTTEVSGMVNAMASMMGSGGTQLAGILADAGLDYTMLGMDVYQKDESGNFILDEEGNKQLDSDKLSNYTGDYYANAVVMMVAQNTNDSSFSTLQTAIASGRISDLIDMSNKGATLSNVAMLYGVAEAYSHSDAAATQMIGDKTAAQYMDYINESISTAAQNKDLQGVLAAIAMIGNFAYDSSGSGLTEQFAAYTNGGQLETDATGYIAAMQTISSNTEALTASGAMATGFDDPTIAAILNAILGSD